MINTIDFDPWGDEPRVPEPPASVPDMAEEVLRELEQRRASEIDGIWETRRQEIRLLCERLMARLDSDLKHYGIVG